MKNHLILALGLAVAFAGCGKSSSGGGGYSTGSAASTVPGSTTQPGNNNLQNVPINNNPGPQPSPSPAAPTAPTVTGITPASGGAGMTVTITGTDFANVTDVQIGGVSLTNVTYAPTEIQGVTGQGPAGAADVVVFSSNGNATLPGAFTYNTAPPPPPTTTYTNTIGTLIANDCTPCHVNGGSSGGVTLDGYSGLMQYVTAGSSANSAIVQTLTNGRMRGKMGQADLGTLSAWIDAGAPK